MKLLLKGREGKTRPDTDYQFLEHRQKVSALQRDVASLLEVRNHFIPVANTIEQEASSTSQASELWADRVWLPSDVAQAQRASGCIAGLIEREIRARIAVALSAMSQLRQALRQRHQELSAMRSQVYGTGERTMTKGRSKIRTVQGRVDRSAELYLRCFNALKTLQPDRKGYDLLQELPKEEVCGPSHEADEIYIARGGDMSLASIGTYQEPWFWYTYGATAQAETSGTPITKSEAVEHEKRLFDQQRRTIWAKVHGRSERWAEETILIQEEMRRTLAFLEWEASKWREHIGEDVPLQATASQNEDHVSQSGRAAYAHEQAAMYTTIASEFAVKWAPLLMHYKLDEAWLHHHLPSDFKCPALKRPKGGPAAIHKSIANTQSTTSASTNRAASSQPPMSDEPMVGGAPITSLRSGFRAGQLSAGGDTPRDQDGFNVGGSGSESSESEDEDVNDDDEDHAELDPFE
jgi:hypothetical protein